MDPDDLVLLTIKEVARQLNIGERSVRRLVKLGHLAPGQVLATGAVRWFQGDVRCYRWQLFKGTLPPVPPDQGRDADKK